MREVVIFDIDGCLCDTTPIVDLVRGPDKSLDAFHLASADCKPNDWVLNEFYHVRSAPDLVPVLLTGRSEKWRGLTSLWLERHDLDVPPARLLMRPTGYHAAGWEYKQGRLDEIAHTFGPIERAYDDDPRIVQMYGRNGIPAVLVPGWV